MPGSPLKHGVWLPLFDELADPTAAAHLAAEAEEGGWDGFFVWDHLFWRPPVTRAIDPWITLAAAAAATSRVALGPMVSPIARRRPSKLARETASLDLLAGGRLVLGVGLGEDRFAGEFARTGDTTDPRIRAQQLDESLDILRAAWTGAPVTHRGRHYLIDDVTFLPTPVRGRVPVWVAAMPGNPRPLRRAAQHDGFFPVNLESADQLAEALAVIADHRGDSAAPFDVTVALAPGEDPAAHEAAGATWCLTSIRPERLRLADVRAVVRAGPATTRR